MHTLSVSASLELPSDDIKLNFTLTASEIKTQCERLIQNTHDAYNRIAKIPHDQRTFENTAAAIALIEGHFSTLSSSLTFPQFVSTDKSVREASVEANKTIGDFIVEIKMREDLFEAVKSIPNTSSLSSIDKRFIEQMLRDFRRSGLELTDGRQKDQLKQLLKRLATLSIEFSATIGEDNTTILFQKEQLAGLSEEQLKGFEQTQSGEYKVTMKYPDYFAIMKYCSREETRREMYIANGSRCKSNGERLVEALKLRHQCAKLLGYSDHASFRLENKMAQNSSSVLSFLEKISKNLEPLIEQEKKELLREKAEFIKHNRLESNNESNDFDESNLTLEPWDVMFYERIQERKIGIDEDSVAKHFPLPKVLEQMLKIYERVLHLSFKKMPFHNSWHPTVHLYQANDKEGGVVGYFFVDLFPREGKYSHAACFPIQPGMMLEESECDEFVNVAGYQYPVAAMVANFSKPKEDGISYLRHSEVVTLFHELGHVMHHICSKTPYARFHGTSVERDFVEAPSQMLENWCWDETALSFITDPQLPKDILNSLLKTKLLNVGYYYRRQLFFGFFDMKLHSGGNDEWTYKEIIKMWNQLKLSLTGIKEHPDVFGGNTFGHLMGGCKTFDIFVDDAGYYGYLWSLVISADFYETQFKNGKGVFDADAGLSYRRSILEPGSSL